ncbi:MAG: substrate-binding domain-containing protein [Planctomycetota bacterium]
MVPLADFSLDRAHPVELSRQLAHKLAAAIRTGTLAPGDRLPSERDLARLFRVSKDTVRKALSLSAQEGLVIRCPSRGTFVASAELFAANRQRRQVYTFLRMDHGSPWADLVRGLSNTLHRLGLELIVKDTVGWGPHEVQDVVRASLQDRPAGLIIYPYFLDELADFYRRLAGADCPVILVDAGLDLGLDAVVIDEDAGVGLAVRHLFARGHRFIGYADVESAGVSEHAQRRIRAYLKACEELSIPPSDRRHLRCAPPTHEDDSLPSAGLRRQFRQLLLEPKVPTGIACFNDWVAAALWAAALDEGLDVPRDLSIVGYDNDRAAESWAHPLTTIDLRLVQMGALAARRLASRLDRPAEKPRVTFVQPRIVLRGSTAEPRSSDA